MTTKELREVDAWIAEHVMGWQWWHIVAHDQLGKDPWCQLVPPDEVWPNRWDSRRVDEPLEGMPDYTDLSCFKPTTDAVAAMEVLKKCAIGSSLTHITQLGDKWIIYQGPDDGFSDRVEAETLELAICLFAKKLFRGAK